MFHPERCRHAGELKAGSSLPALFHSKSHNGIQIPQAGSRILIFQASSLPILPAVHTPHILTSGPPPLVPG